MLDVDELSSSSSSSALLDGLALLFTAPYDTRLAATLLPLSARFEVGLESAILLLVWLYSLSLQTAHGMFGSHVDLAGVQWYFKND